MIDLYCERLGPGLAAEPINALTNLAFLVAAWATWRLMRQLVGGASGVWLLPTLMGAVAMGSGLFHTFATPWARVLDVLPILLFQLVYLWLYARHLLALGRAGSAAILGTFLATALFGRRFPAILNGSLTYVPGVLLMMVLGIHHGARARRQPFALLAAAMLLLIAVVFRSIDQTICATLPIGTHFLWHLLTALVCYVATRALLLNWPATGMLSHSRGAGSRRVDGPRPRRWL
jgi:hypothetical protein